MKKEVYLGLLFAVIFSASIQAQTAVQDSTINRIVTVEQEYAPNIMGASKINVLPQNEIYQTPKQQVEYATSWRPSKTIPTSSMPIYAKKEKFIAATPGYARFGYGNYGNLDLYANYLFNINKRNRLNICLDFDGTNGVLGKENDNRWKSYFYRTQTALNYTHFFPQMILNSEVRFNLSNFNTLDGKQKFSSGEVLLGITSSNASSSIQYNAETNLSTYNRSRSFYEVPFSELQIQTKGAISVYLNDSHQVELKAQMNNFFYTNDKQEKYQIEENQYKLTYNTLTLTPYYNILTEKWKLFLGVQLDLGNNIGDNFRIAPNVMLQYSFIPQTSLYLQVNGGRQFNDFQKLERNCPYGNILTPLLPSYTPLNVNIGVRNGSEDGYWFHLFGGYRMQKDAIIASNVESESNYHSSLFFRQGDLNNLYIGGEFDYKHKIIEIHGDATYYRWTEKKKISLYDLYFQPSIEANVHIEYFPLPKLRIKVGYEHISRASNEAHQNQKPSPVNNLFINGSYELFEGISLYVNANNLLNKEYQYAWGYPTKGFHFLGGASFRF